MLVKRPNYSINSNTKIITLEIDANLSEADKEEIQLYLSAGYLIRRKDMDISRASSERARRDTKADIEKALAEHPKELAEFKRLCKESFFSARAYYYSLNLPIA